MNLLVVIQLKPYAYPFQKELKLFEDFEIVPMEKKRENISWRNVRLSDWSYRFIQDRWAYTLWPNNSFRITHTVWVKRYEFKADPFLIGLSLWSHMFPQYQNFHRHYLMTNPTFDKTRFEIFRDWTMRGRLRLFLWSLW